MVGKPVSQVSWAFRVVLINSDYKVTNYYKRINCILFWNSILNDDDDDYKLLFGQHSFSSQRQRSVTLSSLAFNNHKGQLSSSPIYFYLLQLLEVLPEEGHGPLGPGGAQLHDGVLEQRLDVVLLDIELAFPEAALLLAGGGAGCHGSLRRRHRSLGKLFTKSKRRAGLRLSKFTRHLIHKDFILTR